ncbi:MAG: thiol-disulfide oxidoreductase DCC family protein [Pseudomonadota bacterium]
MDEHPDNRYIVIFDGICNVCNGAVNFIIKRDPDGIFAFTPMQTDLAKQLANEYDLHTEGMDTFILIKEKRGYVFSTAALEISRDLKGYWYLFNVFRIIPAPIRDFFYKLFARNRYRLFGKRDECMVPTPEVRSRFLGI